MLTELLNKLKHLLVSYFLQKLLLKSTTDDYFVGVEFKSSKLIFCPKVGDGIRRALEAGLCSRAGFNFTKILHAAFMLIDTKSKKKTLMT